MNATFKLITSGVIVLVLAGLFFWSERYKPLGVYERAGYVYDRWTGEIIWIVGGEKHPVGFASKTAKDESLNRSTGTFTQITDPALLRELEKK